MIYFDNSATTKISDGAKAKMNDVMECHFGNPSSLHAVGLDAEKIKEEARGTILSVLCPNMRNGLAEKNLIFTSGGTESNNLAMLGTVFAKSRQNNETILISAGEHASIEQPAQFLESFGFRVLRIPTENGVLDLDFIEKNGKDAILCSLMHVNNETGALYDVKSAFDAVRKIAPSCVCHVDAVQSFMKVKFTVKDLGADLISVSSHKVNGPKGVGALFVSETIRRQKKLCPIFFGGGQEDGLRSGTENVYGIAGFGQAVKEHKVTEKSDRDKMEAIRTFLVENLKNTEGVSLNLPKNAHAPHILNLTCKDIKSETMLHYLSGNGICVSSGSACSSHAKKTSRALSAFGLSDHDADCSIRLSFSAKNTIEEAKTFLEVLQKGLKTLVKTK